MYNPEIRLPNKCLLIIYPMPRLALPSEMQQWRVYRLSMWPPHKGGEQNSRYHGFLELVKRLYNLIKTLQTAELYVLESRFYGLCLEVWQGVCEMLSHGRYPVNVFWSIWSGPHCAMQARNPSTYKPEAGGSRVDSLTCTCTEFKTAWG